MFLEVLSTVGWVNNECDFRPDPGKNIGEGLISPLSFPGRIKHSSFQWPLAPHQRHCELAIHSDSEPGFFQIRKLFIFPSDLPPFLLIIILPLPLASVLFQSTIGVGLAEAVVGWLQHHTKHGHLLVVQ